MTNYLKRLIWVDEAETLQINPLFYPFLFATFVYGFGFLFLGGWSGVNSSSLHAALSGVHVWLPAIWGAGATIAASAATILVLRREGRWGEYAALFGWMVWLFAAIVYTMAGNWLVIFTVALPNAYFWVYYYRRLKWYERLKKSGKMLDPQ